MTTLFIFVESVDASDLLTIVLSPEGKPLYPLARRSFQDIKALSKLGQTRIILPACRFSFYHVTLPLLQDKKLQTTIAYALEERLAQPLGAVHIAFDKKFYINGQYLALVCDKTYFTDVLALFFQHGIEPRFVTLDWFALKTNEIAYCAHEVLLHTHSFCGALTYPHFQQFWKPDLDTVYHGLHFKQEEETVLEVSSPVVSQEEEGNLQQDRMSQTAAGTLPTDRLDPISSDVILIEEPRAVWIARRLLAAPQINLRQGQFKQKTTSTRLFYWYMLAGTGFVLWLLGTLVFNVGQIWYYNKQIKPLDAEIAAIYRQFFPDARQILSPEFRVRQWLKTHQNADEQAFFALLNQLGAVIDLKTMSVQRIEWQNQKMMLTLKSKGFEQLDSFKNKMTQRNLRVRQKQASKQDAAVISVWELDV